MRKITRKGRVRKADKAFSVYIRQRDHALVGHCTFCPKPIECCFHFVTRSKYATRWDPANCVGSCFGCNYLYESNPHQFINWYIKKHGLEGYQDLIRRSHEITKFSDDDLLDIEKKFGGK